MFTHFNTLNNQIPVNLPYKFMQVAFSRFHAQVSKNQPTELH